MTVTREDRLVRHRGNGVSTIFPFLFVIPETEFASVSIQTADGGTTLLNPSQYQITGIGSQLGGSVTYPLSGQPLDDQHWIIIERTVPYTQDADIINQGGFYPEVIEQQLDLTVMGLQQLVEPLGRAIKVPVGDSEIVLPSAAERAGKFFAFDAMGDVAMAEGTGADGSLRSDLAQEGGAALIGIKRDAPNTVLQSVGSMLLEAVRITEFGAKFDVQDVDDISNATDDTGAWVAALAYLSSNGGGTLLLPPGASKVTAQIDLPINIPIHIIGTGRRKVYPGAFTVGTPCPSTVVPTHSDRCAFRIIAQANGEGGLCCENFNIATLETGDMPDCAFGWDTGPAFPYGAAFRRLGIHGFRNAGQGSAFDVYKAEAGSGLSVGAVLIENCTINRNNWIARTLDGTSFNGFWFKNNEAGQNGYLAGNGGINISGHDISITENILEATRDAVVINGAYQDLSIWGNYFEANVGRACIRLNGVRGPYRIGPNNYATLDYNNIGQKVIIQSSGTGDCVDPYWSSETHKLPLPMLGNRASLQLNTDSTETFCRVDRLDGMRYSARPQVLGAYQGGVSNIARDLDPNSGDPIPVRTYSTSGSGQISIVSSGLTGSIGDWAGISWLMKRTSALTTGPYVILRANTTEQTRDVPIFIYDQFWRPGEWCVMTIAMRLTVAMTTLNALLYPFGINPAAGLNCSFLAPWMFVVDDVNRITPYVDSKFARTVAAAPTTGTWVTGDTLLNSAGGMFVCTSGGTPGTWGSITPA